MPEYGGYEPRRPHALAALASVHEAVACDGRAGRFALKVFHPPTSTDIRRFYAIEGWLIAAERQREAAKTGGAVLEILACGRCAEGAFAVTPWMERPFEPLVETLGAKGDHLRALAERLLDGLAGWERQFGGPHGRLKPSNVFLGGTGPLATLSARLSDPWHLPCAKPEELRERDLATLGAILVQVVRRRQAGGWPIEEAPEWRALGRAGPAWLAYCNYLINPRPAAGELTIEEARLRLQRIPRDARPGRRVALAAAAGLVLTVGGVVGFARFGDPNIMPRSLRRVAEATGNPRAFRTEVTPDWAKLCLAWATWLGDVQRAAERWDRLESFWAPDDPLRAALTAFRATADRIRPQALVSAAARETSLRGLADAPPENVRRELLRGTVADGVTDAWNRVDRLAQAFEQWPRWAELRDLLALLEARGFTRAGAALRPRLPAASNGAATDVIVTLKLFNDVSVDDTTTLLASQWGAISRASADMDASGDRIQKAMPRLILARLADQASLGGFADSLAEPLSELRRRRAQFLDNAVVRERFLRESPLQAETTEVTVADFARWEQELAAFSHLPPAEDPRLAGEFDTRVNRMTAAAVDLEQDAPIGEAGAAVLGRPDFNREFGGLVQQLKLLRSREIVRRDLPAVTVAATELAAVFTTLEQRLDATLALLRPDIWLKRIAEPVGRFAAVKQRWAAWQSATLTGLTAGALEADRARFRQLREQEHTLRNWLDGLEGPGGFGALLMPDLAEVSADTSETLRRMEAERREQAASAAVAAAEWRGVLPAAAWASVSASVRAPLEAHRRWLGELPVFGAELERLGALLDGGSSWTEGVGETLGRIAKREGIEALTGRAAGWLSEARQIERLAGSSDRVALTAAAQGGGFSRKLTVWRRLGELADWPAGAGELETDGGLVALLRENIGRDVKDEKRRSDLTAELARGIRVRWNRAARNSARDETQLTSVFERMDRFGIASGDLEPPVAYNLSLWQLKRGIPNESDLGRLRGQRDGFVAGARALPTGSQPEVTAFLQKLSAVDLVGDPSRKPTASPRLAGWTENPIDGGQRVSARWSGARGRTVQLEFALVQPPDETPPFYLATTEIAVGDFIALVDRRPEARVVLNELPRWATGNSLAQPWNEPLAWSPRPDFSGIDLNQSWIPHRNPLVKGLLDNASNPVLKRANDEKPTLRSPLQQVPPDAARIFAENLLGARLPRPQEWRAVMKVFNVGSEGVFRGRSFQDLWGFLESYRQGEITVDWRPNAGAFPRTQRPIADNGKARVETDEERLWLAPVDVGPKTGDFIHLVGNTWIYLYDDTAKQYYVAGGSALSPPGVNVLEPVKVEATGMIGATRATDGFSDVGIRPAFDAPPEIRERIRLLLLVRDQPFLTL